MIKTKKKSITFRLVPIIILIVFSTILFFSIPILFDYNALKTEIEKKFFNEFKINLKILSTISQKTLPSSYLLIEKSRLNFNDDSKKSTDTNIENLKIYTSTKNIYSKSNIEMESLEIINSNFNFNFNDIKDLRNHLYYKINKPIKVKNSKIFYIDKDGDAIIISPIHKLEYHINKKSNSKELKIKGNLFDIEYESLWRRNYDDPKNSYNEIKFKDPNLTLKNSIKFINDNNFIGSGSINFLKENIYIEYKKNDENIFISAPKETINQKIKIISSIELNPFYFDTEIIFVEKNFEFIIDNLLYYLTSFDLDSLGNLNGNIKLNFQNIEDEIVDEGKINFNIEEKNINILNARFKINNVGEIASKFYYIEIDNDLIFKSSNILEVNNSNEFAKKFQLSNKKSKKIKKIYFDLNKNIQTGEISISKININKIDSKSEIKKTYIINNIQAFKSLMKKILI